MTTAAEAALAVERAYDEQNEPKLPEGYAADSGGNLHRVDGAVKYDGGKAPVVRGFLSYFPRAIEAVARVSEYGYSKYKGWGGWRKVEDGPARYLEALERHLLAVHGGESQDAESRLWHMQHAAWNALAVLELMHDTAAPPAFKPYAEALKPGSCTPCDRRGRPL